MLTYMLSKAQSMLLSATNRESQPDTGLHAVQNPEYVLISEKEEGQAG